MALTGFPNKIRVVLGTDWNSSSVGNGLQQGEEVILTRDGANDRWTEASDSNNTANRATNRIKFKPDNQSFGYTGQWFACKTASDAWY